MTSTSSELRTGRAVALYVGALLGPGLLLLPGLAVALAGPASIVAWSGLLVLSAALAAVFSALGVRLPGGGSGAAAYAAAAFGPRAGRAVRSCFVTGVVIGAPVVCLTGGEYVATATGGGDGVAALVAAVLLAVVLGTAGAGARSSASVQLACVAVLLVLLVATVLLAAPHARVSHWVPFAPHGWAAVGSAAAALMFCFVGWEAIAPLTARLRDPARQLPRVIGATFAITSTVFLALGAVTVGVLGAGSSTPIADLLEAGIGRSGPILACVAAVVLTLAAVNAYVSGAAAMLADARATDRRRDRLVLPVGVAGSGVVVFGGRLIGVPFAGLVGLPTAMLVLVYVACTAAALRVLRGVVRAAAGFALVVSVAMLAFTGWPAAVAAIVAVVAAARGGVSPGAPPVDTNFVAVTRIEDEIGC